MEKLTELLEKVRKRPAMFFRKPSLELLGTFISGYMACLIEADIHADFYPGFREFIEKKYDKKGTDSFEMIIKSVTTSDEQAFYKFFELLDEFLGEQK